MLVVGILLALAAPCTTKDAADLLAQDQQLIEISRQLADIDLAYTYIENRYEGTNPYPWERFPHKPTLRDRKKALLGARKALTEDMVTTWT